MDERSDGRRVRELSWASEQELDTATQYPGAAARTGALAIASGLVWLVLVAVGMCVGVIVVVMAVKVVFALLVALMQ